MTKHTRFTGLKASAAATFLTLFGLTSDISEDPLAESPPETPAKIFMTEQTKGVYGQYADFIANYAPNLSALIVTERDIRFRGSDAARSILLNNRACVDRQPLTDEEKSESETAIAAARQEILNLLNEFSPDNGQDAMIPKDRLRETLNRHAALLNSQLSTASLKALSNSPASLYMTNSLPTIDDKLAIVTMPSQLKTLDENAAMFSGLPASYIENLQSTPQDWAIFTLGHEIAGHASHGHSTPNPPDYCATPNYEWSSQRILNETTSDIWGIRVFKAAQQAGLASQAPLDQELESLRALWTIYYNRNLETIKNSSELGLHATSLGYDPDEPGLTSPMFYRENAYTARVPLLVNLAADVVAGFVHSRYIKEDMALHPENYTEKQMAEYENVPTSPQYIERNLKAFAALGQQIRTRYPRNPEWHYEALVFLEENGFFDELIQNLGTDEAPAMRDLLDDFFHAAETYAPKLKNPEIARQIHQAIPLHHIDFLVLPRTYGRTPELWPAQEADQNLPPPPSS